MTGDNGSRARRMQWIAVLTLLVVFVAGGLVGAAVERGRDHGGRRGEGPPRGDRRGPPPLFAEGSPIAERLNLTDVQRDSIERLTERDRVRADSVFRETRRGMRARFDSTLMAVDSVLTPQQRVEWQKIRQELQAREGRGRGRGGPGRRGGPDGGMPPSPPPAERAPGS